MNTSGGDKVMIKDLNTLVKESNYKIKAFEEEINRSRDSFYKLRTGKRRISGVEAKKISKLLDLEPIEIEAAWELSRKKYGNIN